GQSRGVSRPSPYEEAIHELRAGIDFNSNRCICEPVMSPITGPANEPRQTRFRADHGAYAAVDLQALRCSLRRRAQGQALLLSRSISVHGMLAAARAATATVSKPPVASTTMRFGFSTLRRATRSSSPAPVRGTAKSSPLGRMATSRLFFDT